MKNQVNVKLFNRTFKLFTEETKDYTDRLAGELNRKMSDLRRGKPSLSVHDAATLICLECYDELVKARSSIENIRTQIKEYVDEANESREKNELAQKEIRALREHISKLERELEQKNLSSNSNNEKEIGKDKKYPFNYKK